jgi:hypothetical protein
MTIPDLKENFYKSSPENVEEKTSSIGETFKQARERQNISLECACQVLKIRKFFLNAIESNNFTDLPGGVYTIGFIQSYGKFLKIDPSSLEKILKPLQPDPLFPDSQSKSFSLKDETYFPSGILVASFIVSLIILITFLAFRSDFVSSDQKIVPYNSFLTVSPSPSKEFDLNQLNPALITFYALDHTWIKITNNEDKIIVTKLLSPGELYQIARDDNLYLTTGDRQAVKIYLGHQAIDLPSPSSKSLTAPLYQNQELLEDFPLK